MQLWAIHYSQSHDESARGARIHILHLTQSWNPIVFSDLNHFSEVQFLLHLRFSFLIL